MNGRSDTANALSFRALDVRDIADMLALLRNVSATLPFGFLSDRSESELHEILGRAGRHGATGVFDADRLVGYGLEQLVPAIEGFQDCPLLHLVDDPSAEIWMTRGLVIAPDFQQQGLMSRLMAARLEHVERSGSYHMIGMIAAGNAASLVRVLRTGMWVVGLEEDRYCLNYVVYQGNLARHGALGRVLELPIDDLNSIGEHLARRWVGTRLITDASSGQVKMVLEQYNALD